MKSNRKMLQVNEVRLYAAFLEYLEEVISIYNLIDF